MLKYANDEDFVEKLKDSSKVVLVEFYATWCSACKKLEYVIEELALQKKDLDIIKVDIDNAGKLAIKYEINVVPTIIIFNNLEQIKSTEGYLEKEQILELIDECSNKN